MKYTTTKPQQGGFFASAAREERQRGLQMRPREAREPRSWTHKMEAARWLAAAAPGPLIKKGEGKDKCKKGGLSPLLVEEEGGGRSMCLGQLQGAPLQK